MRRAGRLVELTIAVYRVEEKGYGIPKSAVPAQLVSFILGLSKH